jgi:prepilin-type N-terminal cleavage/methylation domain-containing protein
MKAVLRRTLNKKGVTLMEMVIALVVLSVILVAVTAVFAPILRTYLITTDYAEGNTILDNIATSILDDLANAIDITPATGTTPGNTMTIIFSKNAVGAPTRDVAFHIPNEAGNVNNGIIMWHEPFVAGSALNPRPLFHRNFYSGKEVVMSWNFDAATGVIELTLELAADGWAMEPRTYSARPVGLAP